ncbi:MAG: histidine kinase dimerization/phospho-acceptor domain-containing protein [Flavonifractor plautii]
MKTPLTVIMTNAELLQDEADEARRSTFSSSILTMSRQMRALIEQMLELAPRTAPNPTLCSAGGSQRSDPRASCPLSRCSLSKASP